MRARTRWSTRCSTCSRALDATDEQLDFPILYGSAKEGWMAESPEGPKEARMQPLFDLVLSHVAPPQVEEGPFRLLGTILEANPYLGRVLTGRITSGTIAPNQTVKVLDHDGRLVEQGRISKVLAFRGLERVAIDEAYAGDIVSIAGLPNATVAHTICAPEVTEPLPAQPIDPPTLSMTFRINDSPLAGTEGDKVTSRMIRDRLLREARGQCRARSPNPTSATSMEVAGRGELQLGILIETMRREGFELSIRGRRCCSAATTSGELLEPIEEVIIDVDAEHSGIVVQKLSERRAELLEMRPSGGGRQRLVFYAPTRGLIGYQGELLSDTRGTAHLEPAVPRLRALQGRDPGPPERRADLDRAGEAVAYALWYLEERGPMLIDPGMRVYAGMIVGEHTRDNDLEVNVLKGKKLTNIRTTGKDEAVQADPADPHVARARARLYRGRRAGRSDAEVDPAAQAPPRRQRPQEGRAPERGVRPRLIGRPLTGQSPLTREPAAPSWRAAAILRAARLCVARASRLAERVRGRAPTSESLTRMLRRSVFPLHIGASSALASSAWKPTSCISGRQGRRTPRRSPTSMPRPARRLSRHHSPSLA